MAEDLVAFPTLEAPELALLDGFGNRRSVVAGEELYREGDAGYDFIVVLSGAIDIVVGSGAGEEVVAQHGAGRFLGELNLLTGQRVFVTARVTEDGEVLAIPVAAFREVIATQPRLSDKILAAFIARRLVLMTGAASSIRVIGSRFSPDVGQIREFLARSGIPHSWVDPDTDPEIEALLEAFGVAVGELPVVVATGSVLRRPSVGELAQFLGLTVDSLPDRCFDLIVVGSGPAGLAAAVYGASEGLRTLGLEVEAIGGQAGNSSRIENYLGFPLGISGEELAQRAMVQAEKFGAHLTSPCGVTGLREEAGHLVLRLTDGTDVAGRAVIAATGAHYRRLDATGLDEYECRGVYYAATEMEARVCAGSPVVVVGGGNSAGQAALFLAETCDSVAVVVRRADLAATMSSYLVDRIVANPRIEVRPSRTIAALTGDDDLRTVVLAGEGREEEIPCTALFSFIGADPASGWLAGSAALDSHGFVLTDRALADEDLDERWPALGRDPLPFETSHPGLFAVGDLRSGSTKRVAAAVGEGSAAVRSVHELLAFSY